MPDARDDVTGAPRRQPGGYRRVPDPRALPMISERASYERPRARAGYHRGPGRHPEDPHSPRATDSGASTPAAAGRPVRLELSQSTRGVAAALYPIASHPNPADVAADRKKLRATERPMGCDGVVTGSAVLGKHTP